MLGKTLKSMNSDTTTNTPKMTASREDSSASVDENISRVAQIYGCEAEDIALAPLPCNGFLKSV